MKIIECNKKIISILNMMFSSSNFLPDRFVYCLAHRTKYLFLGELHRQEQNPEHSRCILGRFLLLVLFSGSSRVC